MADSNITRIASAGMSATNPAIFEGRYEFTMQDDSASPMIEAGQIVVVDPARPPEAMRGVVLFKPDGSEFIVRQFVSSTPDQWVVSRFDSDASSIALVEENLPREEWPIAGFISSVSSRRGERAILPSNARSM